MKPLGVRITLVGSLSAMLFALTGCGAARSVNPFAMRRDNTQLKTALKQYQDQLAQSKQRSENLDADNEQLHNLLAQEQDASRKLRDSQNASALARRPAAANSDSDSEDWDDAKDYGPARGASRTGAGRDAASRRGTDGRLPAASVAGAEVVRDGDKVRIRITNANLFDPGKATLKPGAAQVLDRVAAAVRRDYAGNQIGIEGHTDADPIRKSNWRDNHELSVQRALAVYDYLTQRAGVASDQVYVAGFGPNMPLASNKSSSGKAQNRRVELVIEPSGGRAVR